MNLSLESIMTIREEMQSVELNRKVLNAINELDGVLASHGLKAEFKALPKRKWQRQAEREIVWVNISNNK
jgi:hypothetical protein